MGSHRIVKGDGQLPRVGEVLLVIGEENNRGPWKKGKVVRLISRKDEVVREVVLNRHKDHEIERPIQWRYTQLRSGKSTYGITENGETEKNVQRRKR